MIDDGQPPAMPMNFGGLELRHRTMGPAIDRSVLGEWLAGDDDAINELLAVFRDSACAEQLRMSELLTLGDLDEYGRSAHRLRGAALSMGAQGLGAIAGELHEAARTGNRVACGDGMAMLAMQIRLMVVEIPWATPGHGHPSGW
jgi:histidine phosphotransfer protein HptB